MTKFSSEEKSGKREILRMGSFGSFPIGQNGSASSPAEPDYAYLITEDGAPFTTEAGPRIKVD